MPAKARKEILDSNTETKIKTAARTVFHKKGFAGTRTRDIAKEANMNLALLNYYFGSKQKLFEVIMLESLVQFYATMGTVFNDETTTLEMKIELVVEKYIDLIIAEPELPFFVINEIRNNGAAILDTLPVVNVILESAFIKQFNLAAKKGEIMEPNPLHFIMNLMGMVIFPFIGSPTLKKVGKLHDRQFNKLMLDRKKLIPIWVKSMLKAK